MAEFPLSLMAYLKVGGDDNNLGFMLYFLTLAGFLMHARIKSPSRAADEVDPASPSFRGILVLTFVLTLLGAQQIALAFAKQGSTWQGQQGEALRYIERHPGEVYFPWNPLEHLVAEGRLYHFEYGVFDRILAGYPPTADHFRRYIPGAHPAGLLPARDHRGRSGDTQVSGRFSGEDPDRRAAGLGMLPGPLAGSLMRGRIVPAWSLAFRPPSE